VIGSVQGLFAFLDQPVSERLKKMKVIYSNHKARSPSDVELNTPREREKFPEPSYL